MQHHLYGRHRDYRRFSPLAKVSDGSKSEVKGSNGGVPVWEGDGEGEVEISGTCVVAS